MMAIPSIGTPTMPSTIISSGIEPPGMPATPIAVTTDISTTTSCAPERQLDAEHLGEEQHRRALEQRRAVHVHRRAERQHEAGDLAGDAQLLLRHPDRGRQGRVARRGREGGDHHEPALRKNSSGLRRATSRRTSA